MALLNNPVALIITASLIIQIIVLFLLIYGYFLKRKLKFRQHGITMATALVLHLSMVFYVMIPSFVLAVIPEYIVPAPLAITSSCRSNSWNPWNHSLISWCLASCFMAISAKISKDASKEKNICCKTLTVWIATLIFGITLYAIFIGPVIDGLKVQLFAA